MRRVVISSFLGLKRLVAAAVKRGSLSSSRVAILMAGAFFVSGVTCLGDYGMTWDELPALDRGYANLMIVRSLLTGEHFPGWPGTELLPGYSFILDTLRTGFVMVVDRKWHLMDPIRALHLFHLILSTLTLYYFFSLVYAASQNTRIACYSTLSLAITPQFLAHSQNNPMDLPGVLLFVVLLYCFLKLALKGRTPTAITAGIVAGLAFTTRPIVVLVIPIMGLWITLTYGKQGAKRFRLFLLCFVIATAGATLLWPWLWDDLIGRLAQAVNTLVGHQYGGPVVYLGKTYWGSHVPWHYFLTNFLASLPIVLILYALVSIIWPYSWRSAPIPGKNAITTLGILWCLVGSLAAIFWLRYNSVRHFLLMYPGFSILAGVGADSLCNLLAKLRIGKFSIVVRTRIAWFIVTMGYVCLFLSAISIHPYQGAYLNRLVNTLIGGNSEDYFEIEYWGHAYKEGAEWLNENAEEDADVFVPIAKHCADYYLDRPSTLGTEEQFLDSSRPRYLMFITAKGLYKGLIRMVEQNYSPVFSVHRQKGTLLKIYKNK